MSNTTAFSTRAARRLAQQYMPAMPGEDPAGYRRRVALQVRKLMQLARRQGAAVAV